MATRRVSASDVVSYFTGDDNYFPEVFFEGSDDDLGFEESDDELSDEEAVSNQQPAGDHQQDVDEEPVGDGVQS